MDRVCQVSGSRPICVRNFSVSGIHDESCDGLLVCVLQHLRSCNISSMYFKYSLFTRKNDTNVGLTKLISRTSPKYFQSSLHISRIQSLKRLAEEHAVQLTSFPINTNILLIESQPACRPYCLNTVPKYDLTSGTQITSSTSPQSNVTSLLT